MTTNDCGILSTEDKIQEYKLRLVHMTRNRTFLRISEILDDLAEIVPEHFINYETRRIEQLKTKEKEGSS